jgi:hypothetical protein
LPESIHRRLKPLAEREGISIVMAGDFVASAGGKIVPGALS